MFLKNLCFVALMGSCWTYDIDEDVLFEDSSVSHLSFVHKLKDGSKIHVFDQLLTQDDIDAWQKYLLSFTSQKQFVHKDEDNIGMGLTPFYSVLKKSETGDFKLVKEAKDIVEKSLGKKVFLEDIHGEILHSLDPKPPIHDDCNEHTYSVTIFLNEYWLHNSYGQVSFYTMSKNPNVTDEPRLEIEQTIHPKPGRMILWPSCLVYSSHPPSVNFFGNLFTLKMRFTTDQTNSYVLSDTTNCNIEKPTEVMDEFGYIDTDRKIDYTKHLKRTFYDSENKGIYVFDDLYTTEELHSLKKFLLSVGNPSILLYDRNALENHDNVQWISSFGKRDSNYLESNAWKRLQELLEFVSGENEWYPYDIALNLIRPADHTRIHPDASDHQIEYTFLLYLTEGITRNDFGETVWFDKVGVNESDGIHEFTNPGGEEYEPIASVWPKFGRVVLFRNTIEHSARPLSTSYLGCRYSFAVKVSQTKRKSVVKQIYESMENLGELTDELEELNEGLQHGVHDKPENSFLTMEKLEEMLKNTKSGVQETLKVQHSQNVDKLK